MSGSPRGRPRQFETTEVLDRAIEVFSEHGYSATSLDLLAAAMGLNRPSIYNAFGDKAGVYRAALEHFVARMQAEVGAEVAAAGNLRTALRRLYRGMLDVYFADAPARGCFVFCTAPVEAIAHPAVRALTLGLVEELDALLATRFAAARDAGQLPGAMDPVQTAKLAQATLHSLAIRARAGESRASLEHFVEHTVALLAPVTRRPP